MLENCILKTVDTVQLFTRGKFETIKLVDMRNFRPQEVVCNKSLVLLAEDNFPNIETFDNTQ